MVEIQERTADSPGRRPAPSTSRWQDEAACAPGSGVDPDLFFPMPSETDKIRDAIATCNDCPVWSECRQSGIDGGVYLIGIWGGLTTRARRRLRAEKAGGKPRRP